MKQEFVEFTLNREVFKVKLVEYTTELKMSYMDAIIQICEENNIEYEDVPQLIDANIKSALENEYREQNYLPKIRQLPI